MDAIGVRELRQNASRYLARVAAGETIEVTDRGRPVARLVPVPEERHRYDDLVASGQLLPPEDAGDLLDGAPEDFGIDASAILSGLRNEER